jgi:hypothetical protein
MSENQEPTTKQGKYLATVARPAATINQTTEPVLFDAWQHVLKLHNGKPYHAVKAAIQFYHDSKLNDEDR